MIHNEYNTTLNGRIAITDNLCADDELRKDKSLYKFIWVRRGSCVLTIDQVPLTVCEDEIVALTPLQYLNFENPCEGEYTALLFNSNFYCIFGHDSEVSCNGILFHGGSEVLKLKLTEEQTQALTGILSEFGQEYSKSDTLHEEMLRILLKRFIITCTRIARDKLGVGNDNERSFDVIRQFYVMVDNNFKEKRQVRDYAQMLNRSPKTLSNLFSICSLPSPLQIIHERVTTEAKRLLLYTDKSAKEIADALRFDDYAVFSRFFKNQTGMSVSEFKKDNKSVNRE